MDEPVTTALAGSRIRALPNNIRIVQTSAGDVLVNSPPETLKYLLAHGIRRPPSIVLLPPDAPQGAELGSYGFVRRGISYASVEFLIYSTFFIQREKLRLITTTAAQAVRLRQILEETVSGPALADYGSVAWLRDECAAVGTFPPLGRPPTVDDMVVITSLEAGGGQLEAGLEITLEGAEFVFREAGLEVARLATVIDQVGMPPMMVDPQPLQRGALTLQFIGASDGFDPSGITTCFLAYLGTTIQTQATLFDAAAYVCARLANLGISTNQIAEVVVSHLHEDHIAGLPELLLMGGYRVRVVTAPIIYQSLLRVLAAMLDLHEEQVRGLFDYIALEPGSPIELGERRFDAIYAVHSIPTIAVRVEDLCYSGDMRYDETLFADLLASKVISPARYDELLHFADNVGVLVQDVGGGPIHSTLTPELLRALAAKSRHLILAHTSKHLLPPGHEDLAGRVGFAGSGEVFALGEMIVGDEQIELVETIAACSLLARLPVQERIQLARAVELVNLQDGDALMDEGEPSDGSVYVVHSGLLDVTQGGQHLRILGRGSCLGERGALTGEARSSTNRAHGPAQVLRLKQALFDPIAAQLKLPEAFQRADWLWRLPVFRDLPWASLLDLALDFEPLALADGEQIFSAGELGSESFLLAHGAVSFFTPDGAPLETIHQPGTLFGGWAALENTLRSASAAADGPTEVWLLPMEGLRRLALLYPHLMMHLRVIEANRRARN